MTDKQALENAFNELEYEEEAFNELDKRLQKKVATGVTDGTANPWRIIADLTEALRSSDAGEAYKAGYTTGYMDALVKIHEGKS